MCLRWDYLLVFEILFQGNAARHDGCELDVVHKICAGIFGQVFFDDLASKKANPSDKASDGCGVEYRLHELVVRHGEVYLGFSFSSVLSQLLQQTNVQSSSLQVCFKMTLFIMSQVNFAAVQLTPQSLFKTNLFVSNIIIDIPPIAAPVRKACTQSAMVEVYIVF